ncbi:MAG: GNAT family N-acetyltransferase [Planctomycetota bacterium]|jgi:hypothetical protein
MSWTLVPAREAFPEHAAAWDELNRRLHDGHPLCDSRFVGPLVHHFADDDVVLALDNDEAAGGLRNAALLERRRPGTWATFLPSQAQIAPLLLDAAGPERLLRALPGAPLRLELLCQDPAYSAFPEGPVAPGCVDQPHATTMSVDLRGSFEAYWQARSRKLRKNIRRHERFVEHDGIAERLEESAAPKAVAGALQRYGDLEYEGWKRRAGTAIHHDNVQGRFYADVLTGFAGTGQTRLYEFHLGGRLAAARLTIGNPRMLVLLKTTYDEELAHYAPGRCMLHRVLRREFERKRHATVEFYTNATPELLAWASGTRTIRHVTLYRRHWVQVLLTAAARVRGRRGFG